MYLQMMANRDPVIAIQTTEIADGTLASKHPKWSFARRKPKADDFIEVSIAIVRAETSEKPIHLGSFEAARGSSTREEGVTRDQKSSTPRGCLTAKRRSKAGTTGGGNKDTQEAYKRALPRIPHGDASSVRDPGRRQSKSSQ